MATQGKALAMDDTQLEALAGKVARQQLIAKGHAAEVNGTFIYTVEAGWEAAQLKQDEQVHTVTTVDELAAALEDTEVETLLVPTVAALTLETVKAVVARHSQQKTIFIEPAAATAAE